MKPNVAKRKRQRPNLLDPQDLRLRPVKPGEQNDAMDQTDKSVRPKVEPSELETVDPTLDPYTSPS